MKQSHAPGSQRRKSLRSPYRSIPGARDEGQRYVVSYRDGLGELREFGFTDDLATAQSWEKKLAANPMFTKARIKDRAT